MTLSISEAPSGAFHYTVKASYRESQQELAYVCRRAERIVKRLKLSTASDLRKAKRITRWMVLHLEYDYGYTYNSAYKALKSGKANCTGYALVFQKLASEAGLECRTVRGYMKRYADGGSAGYGYHIWNAVKLGAKWYYLDISSIDTAKNEWFFLFGENYRAKYLTVEQGYAVPKISKKRYKTGRKWLRKAIKRAKRK